MKNFLWFVRLWIDAHYIARLPAEGGHGPLPSPFSLPFLSLPLEVGPLEVGTPWLRSPAAKRILVHFRHNFASFWVPRWWRISCDLCFIWKPFSQYWCTCNCEKWPFSVTRNDEWQVHRLITDVKWTKTSIVSKVGACLWTPWIRHCPLLPSSPSLFPFSLHPISFSSLRSKPP